MRCNNCGWDNEEGCTACTKCGSPIQGGSRYAASPFMASKAQNNGANEQPLRATVMSSPGFGNTQDTAGNHDLRATVLSGSPAMNDSSEIRKTRLIGDISEQIDTPLAEDVTSRDTQTITTTAQPKAHELISCEKCGAEVSAKFAFCPMCGAKLPEKLKGPQFTLTLIPDEGEQTDSVTMEYEGETVVLNRANTEKTNHTITSKEQAVLRNEDGKWFLENRSEMCTTYFEANRRIELQADDIIMLGDRRFKFNIV